MARKPTAKPKKPAKDAPKKPGAPVGNRFWMMRSSHGRKPIFSSPDQLWSACCEYFEWVEQNPLFEMKAFAFQGIVTQEPVAKMRAMTIGGLCLFLDIDKSTWAAYRAKDDFSGVCQLAEETIYQQKFSGAAADLLNPAIIARDLGLADKQELSGRDGGPIRTDATVTMTPEDAYKAMLNGR